MIMGFCSRKFEGRVVMLSVSFVWFLLLVVSLADRNYGRDHINTITISSSTTNVKILEPLETEKSKLNYVVSKRRVPNGPDPIHNRRVGDSKLPPT